MWDLFINRLVVKTQPSSVRTNFKTIDSAILLADENRYPILFSELKRIQFLELAVSVTIN